MATDSSNFLNVSIVGAGIAGLTAAIALRRNGHHVQIFEKYENKTEVGAALGVSLNSLRVLDHLGISRANLKGVPWLAVVGFVAESGESTVPGWATASAGPMMGLLCHRYDLHEELKRVATSDGEGPPAKLHMGFEVIACDPEAGTVFLSSGEAVQADLVLGADGVHSVIRTYIQDEVQKASPFDVSCYRGVLKLPQKTGLHWLDGGVSGSRNIISKDGPFRMLITYPCRNNTLLNFVAVFNNSPKGMRYLKPIVSTEEMKGQFRGFHPDFLSVLDLPVHTEIFKWQLAVLPELPTWVRGRTGLLGDAAHATLPFIAQGAAMAVEDGGTIGCLFPAGTRPEDVPQRLEAYQDIRKQRGEFVSTESVKQLENLRSRRPNMIREILSNILPHDAIRTAGDCYEARFGNKSLSN